MAPPPPPATVTLVSSVNPSTAGQSVTFTVTVSGAPGTPTGSVELYNDTFSYDVTLPLNGAGVAQFTTTALPTGANNMEADYSGDSTHGANSAFLTQNVGGAALTLTSTAAPTTQVGQSYSQTNVASNGTSPYTYSVFAGSVPAGTSLNTSTGTVSGTPTTAGAFNYTIKVTDSATPTANTTTQVLSGTIAKGSQTINFPTPADTAFTSSPPALTATATSGLGVSYGSNSTGVCTVSGSTITFVSGGVCSITASQAGNSNYNAATSVTKTFNVTPGVNTITFPQPADTAFSSAPPALTATASSSLAVSYGSNSTGVCTVSGSAITFVSTGICSITASQAGNSSYAAATPVTKTFNITQGTQSINFPTPADTAFTSAPPALTATATSGLAVSYGSNSTGVCTLSGSTITFVSTGICSITASQAGNGNYSAATPVTKAFNVTPGVNTITFPQPADTAFSSAPPALTATASSGLAVSYGSNSTGVCTVSGSAITFVSTGICSITASQAGNSNYAAATPVTKTFNVTPGVNTITFPQPADTSFTSPPPALTATASSGLAVSYGSNSTAVCTVSGSTITFVSAGICSITASQAGNANYAAATPVTKTFNVTAGANIITFPQPADTPFTSPPPALTATASSGLAVSYGSNSTGVCTVSGSTITFVSGGICSITASQAGNANFAAATPVTKTFNVTPGVNTITFPQPADTPFTSTPPALTATASSSLTVSYASNSTGVCTVSGSTITFVSAGVCSITASQAGNVSYQTATPVTKTFNVTPGANTITFGALANRAFGSGSFSVSATASSGLTVSFASTTPATCSVSGTTVALLAVGQCTIVASQAGNANFQAATSVSQSFTIAKATTSVALTSTGTNVFFGVPITLTATVTGVAPTGTITFLDGATSIGTQALAGGSASLTTKTLASGNHTLTASYSGDGSNSASVSGSLAIAINTRPNPALDPSVVGTINAQVTSMLRFTDGQIDNISGRLNQLHDDEGGDAGSFGLAFNSPEGLPSNASAYQQPARPKDYLAEATDGALLGNASADQATRPQKTTKLPNHFWISGALSFGSQDQLGGITNKFTTSGVTAGFDARWFDGFKAGVAVGFATDSTKIGTDGTRSDARTFTGAVYADYRLFPKTFIDVIAGYGRGSLDSQRFSSGGGVYLTGTRAATQMFGSIALTREQKWGALKLAPFVRFDAARIAFDPYTETGSPIWALSYQQMTTDSTSGVVGLRSTYDIPMAWGKLTALGRLEYRARFQGGYDQQLSYSDLGGTVYTVSGQGISNNQAMLGLGLRAKTGDVDIDLEYQATAANSLIQAHTIRGAIRLGF